MANQRKERFGLKGSAEGCPVEYALGLIGGKWKGVLLYHLINGPIRFNEFRRICPAVTQRMLTLQLRELEEDGLVHREVYHQVPPKVEYSLTAFGSTLIPIIQALKEWGQQCRKTSLDKSEAASIHNPPDIEMKPSLSQNRR